MDAIKNDIYLSTIFNAWEEKVLTYEELLHKVNLYTKNANFDEETLNHILEEVEKFRIHKKEYSNDDKRTYLSKLMLDENTEKYGTKVVYSMSDAAVDKVFENEVKEIKDEDIDKLLTDKANCYAKAYDIVINGYEAGGGSIRIHNQDTQKIMFEALGFTDEEAKEKFGFLMEAFKYGTPPHGGFALGLDRLTMLLTETDNIRDVIAFPKTASASCLLTEAPNVVSEKQLEELGLQLKEEKKNEN